MTTRAHGHKLFSQSTQRHNRCFVSGIIFCSSVVTVLRVFCKSYCLFCVFCRVGLLARQKLLFKIGNSSKKNNSNQMLQIRPLASQVDLIRDLLNASILPAAGFSPVDHPPHLLQDKRLLSLSRTETKPLELVSP